MKLLAGHTGSRPVRSEYGKTKGLNEDFNRGASAASDGSVMVTATGINRENIPNNGRPISSGNSRGLTLFELLIAVGCLIVIMVVAYESIYDSSLSCANLNAWNDLIVWSQTSIDEINLELTQAHIIHQNDTLGTAYISKLNLDPSYPIITNAKLPVADSNGQISVDTTTSRTGNALLFVQELPHFSGEGLATTRRVDTYRFTFYYLSKVNRAIGAKSESLRLIKWTSIPFADYAQVMSLTGADRTAFVVNLFAGGIRYLCIPRNMPDSAFYAVEEDGSISAAQNYIIQRSNAISVIGSLGTGFATVAWNNADNFEISSVVPKFTNGHMYGDGFPHGFEIQVVGVPAARKVMVRLVLAYYITLNKSLCFRESMTITTFHEF